MSTANVLRILALVGREERKAWCKEWDSQTCHPTQYGTDTLYILPPRHMHALIWTGN